MKDKIKSVFTNLSQKLRLWAKITLLITIILLTLLITITTISINLPESDPIQQMFIIGKIIIGMIFGIEFVILTGVMVANSHRKIKRLAILGRDRDLTRSLWKYPILIMFPFGIATFFLYSSVIDLLFIEYLTRAFYHPMDLYYLISIPTFISIIVVCTYRGIIKKTILPKWRETVNFKSLIGRRSKISIKELQRNFRGKKDYFYDSLLEWIRQFQFTIEGDMIILNKDTVEDFIKTLDSKYREWDMIEKKKIGDKK